ncbi:hypothetical protein [Serratia proteamaculans]|uniref:hypothetical protein n=1 Tax=Serratia proteamaculans TaxID=28151 RepID=UPI000EC5F6BE|nr:hypothetical protein [Serratia proteamaculans]HCV64904.1 hypothetical protein [Serratia sp. (in: enterobacteria)]
MKATGPVLYPCLAAAALGVFAVLELLVWRAGGSYPDALVQVRYVDKVNRLTPQAIREICNQPLIPPELVKKRNGLFLRCGTPGLQGVYRIQLYSDE